MRMCIIGTNKKTDFDLKLIESAKKHFEKVLFVPINNLALTDDSQGSSVRYRTSNLSKFDTVLFKVPRSKYSLAYHVVRHLGKKITKIQQRASFLRASSKLYLYQALAKKQIKVPKTLYSGDTETVKANIKYFNFPVLIKVLDKNRFMLANSEQELKSMIDALETLKQTLIIEEYYPEADLFKLYVVGNEVIANFKIKNPELNYTKGEQVKTRALRKMINTALATCKALKTEIGVVSILDAKEPIVVDVSVCPYFENLETDYSETIMERLKELSEHTESSGVLYNFIDEFKKTFKEKFKN